ncbi:MAG TPA: hypothetical protein VFE07_08285 [Marmoricola sp.]|nr:hypothetical protein [Marmoricola sp.]
MRSLVAVGGVVLVLSGCGSQSPVVTGETVANPYDGPMSLPLDHSDDATVAARSGAAGRALECDGPPFDGGGGDYDSGLASTQSSAEHALSNLFDEDSPTYPPHEGYRVERRDGGRVLFSFDVGGRTKVAFIASDDVRDWKHHTGWGIESWAQCDPAELPDSATGSFAVDVWTDASGARVPVSTVTSWPGPEHCDWQDIIFLELGSDASGSAQQEYLRDTRGKLADLLDVTYEADATLPKGATDTGWRHDGRELWLVPDRSAAYLVRVGDATDVERWPASTQPIGCD